MSISPSRIDHGWNHFATKTLRGSLVSTYQMALEKYPLVRKIELGVRVSVSVICLTHRIIKRKIYAHISL